MRRGKPPRRHVPLRSGPSRLKRGRIAVANRKRRAASFQRAYGGADRVAWIAQQQCVVTGHRGNVENVHVRGGGVSRKADACWIVPMLAGLHRELHRIGLASFERKYDIDLTAAAIETEARWQDHLTRSAAA